MDQVRILDPANGVWCGCLFHINMRGFVSEDPDKMLQIDM